MLKYISKKSLKVLDQKLLWLADYAGFEISINAVVGSGILWSILTITVIRREIHLHR
jgi:hypothetical protein